MGFDQVPIQNFRAVKIDGVSLGFREVREGEIVVIQSYDWRLEYRTELAGECGLTGTRKPGDQDHGAVGIHDLYFKPSEARRATRILRVLSNLGTCCCRCLFMPP